MAKEPRWVPRIVLDAVHLDQLRAHGGLRGIRDENALESALARAQQKRHDAPKVRFADLVAAYGFGLASHHRYQDGNKRTAFLAMAIFAGLNGFDLVATDAEVVTVMVGLAVGKLTEPELAGWLDSHLVAD
jgi:death-on-curing protein